MKLEIVQYGKHEFNVTHYYDEGGFPTELRQSLRSYRDARRYVNRLIKKYNKKKNEKYPKVIQVVDLDRTSTIHEFPTLPRKPPKIKGIDM